MKELIKLINTIKKKKTKKKVCFFLGNTKKKESTKFFLHQLEKVEILFFLEQLFIVIL